MNPKGLHDLTPSMFVASSWATHLLAFSALATLILLHFNSSAKDLSCLRLWHMPVPLFGLAGITRIYFALAPC